jgi:hypothetical protein
MSPPALVGTSLCVSVMSIVSVDQPKKCSFVGASSRESLMSVLKWGWRGKLWLSVGRLGSAGGAASDDICTMMSI